MQNKQWQFKTATFIFYIVEYFINIIYTVLTINLFISNPLFASIVFNRMDNSYEVILPLFVSGF